MTQITFEQFVHPLSEFPQVVYPNNADEPMLDVYTMAGMMLYAACCDNNSTASEYVLSKSAINAGLVDTDSLFNRCKIGEKAAIFQMISLIASAMEIEIDELKPL